MREVIDVLINYMVGTLSHAYICHINTKSTLNILHFVCPLCFNKAEKNTKKIKVLADHISNFCLLFMICSQNFKSDVA